MKFVVGFAVGALVGRPILGAVSRRINLTERIEKKVFSIAYNSTHRLHEKMERVIFGDETVEENRPPLKYKRYTR